MRFSRSLRKAIAASLALTMLTVPLAGCSRTVTTGGFSGRGILGDFLVGGFYGGFLGGFLCPGEELPEGAFKVALPRPNDERLLVEVVGMDAVRYYTHARIATEKLSRMNKENSTPEQYAKLLRETAELWQYADDFANAAQTLAKRLAEKEKKAGYQPLAMIDRSPFGKDFFFSVAYAEENKKPGPRGPESWGSKTDRIIERGTTEWAKNIEAAYKKYPAGQEIYNIAKNLHVDTATAKRAFLEAKQVLERGEAKEGVRTGNWYRIGEKVATTVKTGCQTALYIGGLKLSGGLTGGATGVKAAFNAVNTVATGADLTIDIINTGYELVTDDTNPTLDEIKEWTGPIATIFNGVALITSGSDFALRGPEAVKLTQKTLKDAGLKVTEGILDKYNIGGAGVAFLTDCVGYALDRVLEKDEGMLFGIQIKKDGSVVVKPYVYTYGEQRELLKPRQLSEIPLSTLNKLTSGTADDRLISSMDKILAQNDSKDDPLHGARIDTIASPRIQEIIEEDAKRRREIAEDEARREKERRQEKPEAKEYSRDPRFPAYVPHPSVSNDMGGGTPSSNMGGGTAGKTEQQRPEELSYTPSRMAGYYTVTTAKGDMAMRVVLKVTGENTLRVIEVQQRSDKKGKGKYTITIDPKTGKGKTEQGQRVQFEVMRDGVTFMGTLKDIDGTWRFVKH